MKDLTLVSELCQMFACCKSMYRSFTVQFPKGLSIHTPVSEAVLFPSLHRTQWKYFGHGQVPHDVQQLVQICRHIWLTEHTVQKAMCSCRSKMVKVSHLIKSIHHSFLKMFPASSHCFYHHGSICVSQSSCADVWSYLPSVVWCGQRCVTRLVAELISLLRWNRPGLFFIFYLYHRTQSDTH